MSDALKRRSSKHNNDPKPARNGDGRRRKSGGDGVHSPSQADMLVDLALKHYAIGQTEEGEPFAVQRGGPNVARLLRSAKEALRSGLARDFRRATGKTPGASALADALNVIAGEALEKAPEPVHLRLAEHQSSIVIDLGDQTGRAIVVNERGWCVVDRSPVLFRRTALTAPLPEPKAPGNLSLLRSLLNVSDNAWRLVRGWLVSGFIPAIPHPLLMLGGEQGAGKSTAAKLLAGLIDPSTAPLQCEPKNVEGWAMTASGSWVVCVDNVSHISPWWSDALCRAVTGDALVRRTLYTNSDLSVLKFRRLVVLTSIDAGALRGDLGDRLLLVDLERISGIHRRSERELLAEYNRLRPTMLAGLLDLLVEVLRERPNVHLAEKSRMADFAETLAAMDVVDNADKADDSALNIYLGQHSRIAGDVVDADPVASAIVDLIEQQAEWTGTASELLARLLPERPGKGWPTSPQGLGGWIKRVAPALQEVGIEVERGKAADRNRTRQITIRRSSDEVVRNVQMSDEASYEAEYDEEQWTSSDNMDDFEAEDFADYAPTNDDIPF